MAGLSTHHPTGHKRAATGTTDVVADLLAAEHDIAGPWFKRFTAGAPNAASARTPLVARDLFHCLLVTLASSAGEPALADAAYALGILRAQQGHGTSAVMEDVLALRPYLWGRLAAQEQTYGDPAELLLLHERLAQVTELTLRATIDAYVEETSRMLAAKASRDALTGLVNRAGFEEAIDHEIKMSGRTPPPSLLLIDLDGFKAVNDTAGHLAGDQILAGVARVLEDTGRAGDVVARLGGDEFAILLPQTDARRAEPVARRLLERAAGDQRLAWSGGRVGLSVGIGWLPVPQSREQLVEVADAAMYSAKRAGGRRLHIGAIDLTQAPPVLERGEPA